MGLLQSIGKRVALQVAALVSRNELFERYGDRPTQPPLSPDAWSQGADDDVQSKPSIESVIPRLMGATAIKRGISAGPMVVNHWATWCESCSTEKTALKALFERINVPMVGVSWDAFEGASFDEALEAVQTEAADSGLAWEQWVVKGKPPHFFKVLGVQVKQVPQTWLVNAEGEVVHCIEGPIDASDVDSLVERVEAL